MIYVLHNFSFKNVQEMCLEYLFADMKNIVLITL